DKTVGSYVNDTVQAAKAANDAVEVAETEVSKADDKYTATVKEYNKFAMMYGKAIYGATDGKGYSDDYTDADFMAAGFDLEKDADLINEIKSNLRTDAMKNAIESQNNAADLNLDSLGQQISDAESKMDEAQANLASAKNAADKATETVNEALNAVTNEDKSGYADVAKENAAIVFDGEAFVADARKAAEEKAAIKESRTREYQFVVAAKEEVCGNANTYIKAQQRIKDDQDMIIAVNEKILQDEKSTIEEYAKARAEIEKAKNKKADADGAISSSEEAKKMAVKAVEKAAADLETATNDFNEAQKVLGEKKAAQEARNAEADKAYEEFKANASSEIRNAILDKLKECSDSVNQVEYDKALNAWANQGFEKYDSIFQIGKNWTIYKDSRNVREGIDDIYSGHNLIEQIIDDSVFQIFISSDKEEEVMDAVVEALRSQMAEYEKTLATIDAKYALEQANEAVDGIKSKKTEIRELKTEINAAQATLTTANVGLAKAKKEYDAAVESLKNLKDGIDSVSEIELINLLKQIEIAEAEVESAKANLDTAKAARDEAAKCAEQALVLMDQYKAANQPSIGGSASEPVVIIIPPADNSGEASTETPAEIEVATASLIAPAPATDAAQTVAPATPKATTATRTSSKAKTDSKAQAKEITEIADEKTPLAAEKKADDKKDEVIEVISDEETPLAAEKNMTLIGVIVAGISFVLAVISVIFLKKKNTNNK
ncbi:MAG: hypothetical protein HUJ98_03315, partial [Bacteroidaceae bacterium]|nr:hypothetical protein [Bacteroidaceae bacterium]